MSLKISLILMQGPCRLYSPEQSDHSLSLQAVRSEPIESLYVEWPAEDCCQVLTDQNHRKLITPSCGLYLAERSESAHRSFIRFMPWESTSEHGVTNKVSIALPVCVKSDHLTFSHLSGLIPVGYYFAPGELLGFDAGRRIIIGDAC
jgi:hypothetical protein